MSGAGEQDPLSTDYHDYVFRDGKLVGDFDGMYRHAREIPWRQDELCRAWPAEVALSLIGSRAPYASILEIGCGLGYFAERLTAFGPVHGCDVSPEAVRRAAARVPAIRFWPADVASAGFSVPMRYGLVVVRDVLWYVCHHLEQVLANLDASLAPGGMLAVIQSFPALDRPYVGREVIDGPATLLAKFARFRTLRSAVLRDHAVAEDGPICVLLASRD